MGTFTVSATLSHPERPERRLTLDLIVDTGATYSLLPAEIVQQLSLDAARERPAVLANGERVMLASGQRVVYRLGDVRIRLGEEEHTTTFLAGPAGCRALFGAFALELFGLAVDPVHQRLFPVPALL